MTETAVVIGVGPGLGSALVRCFSDAGMRVAAARRQAEKLDALAEETGAKAYGCDVAEAGEVEALFSAVESDLGRPDLVVFNPGAMLRGSILELDPGEIERVWRVTTLGGFHVGQAAAKQMAEAGTGTIIFTGATAALRGGANFAAFAAAKAGLRMLSQSMARELGPKGIHVAHTVIDGLIANPEREGRRMADHPEEDHLDPAAIAEAYLQLHRQPKNAWTQELDLRPWLETF